MVHRQLNREKGREKIMKIKAFQDVLDKFWLRASMLFPTVEFKTEVCRHACAVSDPLFSQLGIKSVNYTELPGEQDMCDEAEKALREFCRFLDEKDAGVDYTNIAGFSASVIP